MRSFSTAKNDFLDGLPLPSCGRAPSTRSIRPVGWRPSCDPATRTFQALRIWVNQELEGLDDFLATALRRLRSGARLAVIAFHSLEDRIVKHTLRGFAHSGELAIRVLTKRPIVPADAELTNNPRSRSAKLRVAERLA
jgi:16S rRNA (cytosine1402-N4)-methyltransferase